jgi:PAS domain S-box-containing protein
VQELILKIGESSGKVKIRTKLVLGLFVVLIIHLGVSLYAVWLYNEQSKKAAQVYALCFQVVETSLSAQVHFKKQVQEWKNVLLRGHDATLYDKYLKQFYQQERATQTLIEELITLIPEGSEAQRVAQEFLTAHTRLGRDYRAALDHYATGVGASYRGVDKRVRGIDRQPTELLDQFVDLVHEYRNRQITALETETTKVNTRILITMLGMLIGSIMFAIWLIDRNIGRHIAAATFVAGKISSGDFSSKISVLGHDEVAQMLQALQTMEENLVEYKETLRKSEEKTRLLLDSSGQGIYGVNTEGQCIFCNPAGLNMLGYPSDLKLLGNDMHSLIHHSYLDGRTYPLDACKASQTYRDGIRAYVDDEVFWRADGTSFPVEYRSFPIYYDDNLQGAVVTFADITERKQIENNLKEAHAALAEERAALAERVRERTVELRITNAELARSARSKDEFLASMSHEFRTPLTSILGNSEILIDQLQGPLNDKQKKSLKTIEESANHLLSLINDILDVAKVEAGKMTLLWDKVPVRQLCEASLRLIRQSAAHKALKVSSHLDAQVQIIPGDSRRLKQLLVNLLSNAVKFTPQGGAIGLDVVGNPTEGQVRFTVWDTGIGVDEKQQPQLFKPFIQLDSKLSRQYGGTGLGLALVQRMAELHEGKVTVQSTPGKGSRFNVLLPWDPSSNVPYSEDKRRLSAEKAEVIAGLSWAGTSVLLAEDDEAILAMLADYLEARGYSITTARDGEEVVSIALQHRPDVVLMDIQMPGVDGLKAIERLREAPGFRKTPIIALTALAMPGDQERCLEAGADDYLCKPVGLKELHQKIQSWVQRV